MKTVDVKHPETIHFLSEKCPDHWTNKIVFGYCWKHKTIEEYE